MQYECRIQGTSPILMHNGAAGLDTRSPQNREIAEIAKKKGTNRTVADDERLAELECYVGLYVDPSGAATLPASALWASIEQGARKFKQGPQVREGLIIADRDVVFEYDRERYGITPDDLAKTTQFTVPVVVNRARILRTRPMFEDWACRFLVDADEGLVDEEQLWKWVDTAGRRVGLGDWRPQMRGHFGRFEVKNIRVWE